MNNDTRSVIGEMKRRSNIDDGRVYVTGISNGGGMAQRMACEAADIVTAASHGQALPPFSAAQATTAIEQMFDASLAKYRPSETDQVEQRDERIHHQRHGCGRANARIVPRRPTLLNSPP